MLFRSTLVGSIANIILNILLIPKFGAIAGAVTTMISYFIVWLMRFIDTRKYVPIRYNYLVEGITMLLVFSECVIMSFQVPGCYLIFFAIFALIIFIHRHTYVEIINSLKPGIMRLFGKSKKT